MPGNPEKAELQIAYFGVGCFYGVECIYGREHGVMCTAAGFMGGHVKNPSYKDVCTGTTGHCEVVRVSFDPAQTSYESLLHVFWDIPDHPTRHAWRRRTGKISIREDKYVGNQPDVATGTVHGWQYRSALFPTDQTQMDIAMKSYHAMAKKLEGENMGPVLTEVSSAGHFFMAEDYQQKYILQYEFPSVYDTLNLLLPRTTLEQGWTNTGHLLASSTLAAKLNGFVVRPDKRTQRLFDEIQALSPPTPLLHMMKECKDSLGNCFSDAFKPRVPVLKGSSCGESVAAAELHKIAFAVEQLPPEPERVIVMDGSMGRLLLNSGVPSDDQLWSARALVEAQYHSIVVETHQKYIEAGAECITTCNFNCVPYFYRQVFKDDWEGQLVRHTEASARLAAEARTKCGADGTVRILGCLPPISRSHRPDLAAEFIAKEGKTSCVEAYRTIAEGLVRGGPVDAFLAETMNSWEEAELTIEAVKDFNVPLIVSLEGALRNHALQPQTHLAASIAKNILHAKAKGAPIEALSFNCAPPEHILECLRVIESSGMGSELRKAGILLGAYANVLEKQVVDMAGTGKIWHGNTNPTVREDLQDAGYIESMREFRRHGASYVGGCCGSTPAQICAFNDGLNSEDKCNLNKKRRVTA